MRLRMASLFIVIAALGLAAAACGAGVTTPAAPDSPPAIPTAAPANLQVAFSDKARVTSPSVPDADLESLVSGNTAFALGLYGKLAEDAPGNLFMSPYSISLALAMTYAGARGQTATEMAAALGFTLDNDRLHAAFNSLDQALAARGQDLPPDEKFTLEVINQLWGQQGFEFEQEFLDTLAESYGAGMRLVDYVNAAEAAREAINGWVEDHTNDRIKDLIPQGALDDSTRLVLTNAIFFKASWLEEFSEQFTEDADFRLLDGSAVSVPLMRQQSKYNYAEGDGYQAIEIPYVGGETSMLVLLPEQGRFEEFEAGLNSDRLRGIISAMAFKDVALRLPKFEFESKFALPDQLKALGMELAFDRDVANFSGMRTPPPRLYISDVIHQSFVSVDEQGTEAAAATAVIMKLMSGPSEIFEFIADRPFIFLIRDIPTGTVLFMGRLQDPSA